jgi:hypothetical protein
MPRLMMLRCRWSASAVPFSCTIVLALICLLAGIILCSLVATRLPPAVARLSAALGTEAATHATLPTATSTATCTASLTATATPTGTPTLTPTPTITPPATRTPTPTRTPYPTPTPIPTVTATITPTPTLDLAATLQMAAFRATATAIYAPTQPPPLAAGMRQGTLSDVFLVLALAAGTIAGCVIIARKWRDDGAGAEDEPASILPELPGVRCFTFLGKRYYDRDEYLVAVWREFLRRFWLEWEARGHPGRLTFVGQIGASYLDEWTAWQHGDWVAIMARLEAFGLIERRGARKKIVVLAAGRDAIETIKTAPFAPLPTDGPPRAPRGFGRLIGVDKCHEEM